VTTGRPSLANNAVGLAKAGRALNVPVVFSTVESASLSGPTSPQLLAALGTPEPVAERDGESSRPACHLPMAR
jgi:hypothetical protein